MNDQVSIHHFIIVSDYNFRKLARFLILFYSIEIEIECFLIEPKTSQVELITDFLIDGHRSTIGGLRLGD